MAAEREEIILDADALEAEDLGEDAAQRRLRRVARRDIAARDLRVEVGRGKRLAVDLAIGRQGQRVERDEGRRDHIIGQLARQRRAQLRVSRRRAAIGDHIGDEPLLASPVLPRENDGLADLRQAQERRLDLAELDAEAADLDLMIDAAQELDVPIRPIAREVAGSIQPLARLAERVRNEALRRQIRPPQITARKARPADVELARNADRDRQQTGRLADKPEVFERPTNDALTGALGVAPVGRLATSYMHSGLCDAIHIDQPTCDFRAHRANQSFELDAHSNARLPPKITSLADRKAALVMRFRKS